MALRFADPLDLKTESNIIQNVEPWQQGVFLKHHGTIGTGAGYLPAVQYQFSGSRRKEPGDKIEKCRLPASGRAKGHDKFLVVNFQIDPAERCDGRAAVSGWKDNRYVLDT